MPRFVILEHDHPKLHWDFMLETGEVLRTWRLAEAPVLAGATIPATTIGDHRRFYLDYEGPVSGGRGCVSRWDAGDYEDAVIEVDRVQVRLQGQRLRGAAVLERTSRDEWRFWYQADS
jgi:DNA polymerase Ligase (LigD)